MKASAFPASGPLGACLLVSVAPVELEGGKKHVEVGDCYRAGHPKQPGLTHAAVVEVTPVAPFFSSGGGVAWRAPYLTQNLIFFFPYPKVAQGAVGGSLFF